MNIFSALAISSSGLRAQRLRMDLIASNLANINSTRTPEGGPYRRKELVVSAVPVVQNFKSLLESRLDAQFRKVEVLGIKESDGPLKRVYNPVHPDADEKGYVSMPNINLIEEMVNMLMATRSYEANVAAINSAKNMAMEALRIGK